MRLQNIVFVLLLLVGFSVPSAAWSDDCERYPNSVLTDEWSTSGTVRLVQSPAEYETNHEIEMSEVTEAVSTRTARSSITSHAAVYDGYMSFVVKYRYAALGGPESPETRLTVYLINDEGTTVATCNFINTISEYDTYTPKYCELVTVGNNIYGYVDGVSLGDVGDAVDNHPYYVKVESYVMNRDNYVSSYATVRIDDFSTSSIIGSTPNYAETSDQIEASYTIQAYNSYPSSAYAIDLYSLSAENAGKIATFNISGMGSTGVVTYDINNLGTNFGLYMLELSKDSTALTNTYIYYSSIADPGFLPELLFTATSNAGMEIRDADNNGGIITSGGSVYLYPDNDSGIYPIRYTLQDTPYSFTASLNAVYGNSLINSTPFTFSGLSNNYVVTLDGESLAGTHASGDLVFADNVTDGETVTIGSDVYEFEAAGGVTGGNIQVNIGNVSQTAENLTTAINTVGLSAVSASVVETPASSSYYYSDIEITNNPGIVDYQAKVTIPFETGMSADFSNIRFFDSGMSIPYWVESKTDSTSAVVWIPISAGSDIQCRWGISGETESESSENGIFLLFHGTATSTFYDTPTFAPTSPYIYEASVRCTSLTSYNFLWGVANQNIVSTPDDFVIVRFKGDLVYLKIANENTETAKTESFIPTTDTTYKLKIVYSGTTYTGYVNDNEINTGGVSTNFPNENVGIFMDVASGSCAQDYSFVRKYAATEPTLSVGAAQINSGSALVTSVHIVSDSIGIASNSVTTTETCTDAEFEAETLTGGSGGSIVNTPTWSYEITDWTSLTTHIFSFSPDLTVPGVYGYVKDVSTQAAIQSATVTIVGPNSTQYVYTDENGFYYLTNGMELNEQYTVSAAKSGYAQGVSFTVSTTAGATTRKDLYMDPVASGGSGIYYSPHYVRFVVTDKYLFERYSGANVTISGTNATTTTQMTGTDGACGFEMTTSTRYAVNTVYGGVNQTDYITPTENSYYIILDATGTSLLPTSQFYETCNITITKNEVNSSHATITTMYSDTGTGTNSVYFVLGQTYENNNTLNVMETSNVGTGNMTYTFTVHDYVGEDYVIKAVVDHDSFGDVEKYYGINFPGSALPFKGNMIIALVVLVFFVVAMQWGKADAHMGAVLICGLGWWFYYLDIFEKLGSATNTVIGVGLGLATVYAVLSMINKKRDEGGI